jgi:two-component system chemotaxis response regulator CheY
MTKQANILIAEDDAHIALALKMIIRKINNGGRITVVNDGEQALGALHEADYDLVISDWNMPLKTGMELLTEVRSNNDMKHIPFLMLTARTDLGSVKEALSFESTDYISKPFDNDEVAKKVISLLTR